MKVKHFYALLLLTAIAGYYLPLWLLWIAAGVGCAFLLGQATDIFIRFVSAALSKRYTRI